MDTAAKKISFRKRRLLIQEFPEVCAYSCSKNHEIRTFTLLKEFYELRIFSLTFRFFELIRVQCRNCRWHSTLPGSFAKKAFKKGLKSHQLVEYAHNKIISSRILHIYAGLWRVWIGTLSILFVITIFRLYYEPVIVTEPRNVTFAEAKLSENSGKLVTINGKVDYTLALLKETKTKDNITTLKTEVFLPFFSKNGSDDFMVIRGGKTDVDNVLSRENITNYDLLKNQDYTVTARVEEINSMANENLKNFFLNEMPQKRNLQTPKVLLNSADVLTLPQFYNSLSLYFYVVIFLLVTSTVIQFYLDRLLVER